MKYLFLLLLTGCVTPEWYQQSSIKIDKQEMLFCRTMCNKNTKMYTPMTGECECYPNK